MQQKHFESLYPENARDSEIEQLVSYIKEGNSSQLVGVAGAGRSSVLGLLAYNTAVRLRHFPKHHGIVHFVMVNFSEIKMRSYPEVVKFIFLCLDSSLRERDMQEEYEKIDGLFKEGLGFNDELVLTQRLKSAIDYLAVEKKLTVIFLFNQFDEYIPQVNGELFILLRSLRDRAKYRFSVIFSVSRPLEDSLEPELLMQFSDFLVGHTVYLQLFDEVSVLFRVAYLEKLTGKKLPEATKKELVALTGGHLRLIKNSTEALLARDDLTPSPDQQGRPSPLKRRIKGEATSFVAFLLEQKTVQAALKSIWISLTPSEQTDIFSLYNVIPAKAGIQIPHGQVLRDDDFSYLGKIGLIKDSDVAIPLLTAAIQRGLFKENEAKLLYDEASNTIKKGEIVFSDGLTKGEFRLLRYLLQHPDEIIERDAIVVAVWKENKTLEGISEQAIDQLIFRLRRKIESDPLQPQHIQTVKGRGIKYTS